MSPVVEVGLVLVGAIVLDPELEDTAVVSETALALPPATGKFHVDGVGVNVPKLGPELPFDPP